MDLSPPTGDQALEWGRWLFGQWTALGDSVQLIATFAVLVLAFVVSGLRNRGGLSSASENAAARAAYQRPVALPKVGNRGLVDKALQKWIEPITLAGVKVETKDKHIAIGATTGARKTTLIANMIMQARRPCVVIAGDNSPYAKEAMLARGWRIWSADGKNGGLYVFEGTPNEAAQIVTVLLNPRRTTGDTGLQRGMARDVFRDAIQRMDDSGNPRTWLGLKQALLQADPPEGLTNRNFDQAKANWVSRIKGLMEALGPALGHDISVLDCVRSECGLFFDLNAFSDLDLAQSFGEAAVRLSQHAADKTGDFWWIIDELALFDAELLGQIVRTCRIRRVKFVGASQIISDFGKVLRGLVKVWFVGEQTAADQESRRWCSELTMGYAPPENFAEHATPPGFYYAVADGRTQELQVKPWHHPKPAAPLRIYTQRTSVSPVPPLFTVDTEIVDTEVEPDEARVEGPPEMPAVYLMDIPENPRRPGANAAQLLNIWTRHRFPEGMDGCYESTFSVNNSGRPRCSFMGSDWTTYVLIRALEDARCMGLRDDALMGHLSDVQRQTAAGQLTVDHTCEFERCDRPDHLAWLSRSRNSELWHENRRAERVRDVGAAAAD